MRRAIDIVIETPVGPRGARILFDSSRSLDGEPRGVDSPERESRFRYRRVSRLFKKGDDLAQHVFWTVKPALQSRTPGQPFFLFIAILLAD